MFTHSAEKDLPLAFVTQLPANHGKLLLFTQKFLYLLDGDTGLGETSYPLGAFILLVEQRFAFTDTLL